MFRGTRKLKAVAILAVGVLSILAQQGDFEAEMRRIEAQLGQVEQTAQANHTQIDGIMVPGKNLAEKLTWLSRSGDSHNTYIIELNANESANPHTFQFSGGINITVVLRGDNQNRTIRLSSHGTMFTVRKDVTLVLDNNITLMGHSGNSRSLVSVNGGTLRMNNGATITGNIVSGNCCCHGGSGVRVNNGTFEMIGGTISGNTTGGDGGGVNVVGRATFNMSGGTISGNNARSGGGVWVNGTFNMRGGTIASNMARVSGGGVIAGGQFTKGGGTITGHANDPQNGNVVRDAEDFVLARKGHAVYISDTQRRERTAGPDIRMNKQTTGTAGGWDN
jgi:hypothetical protein